MIFLHLGSNLLILKSKVNIYLIDILDEEQFIHKSLRECHFYLPSGSDHESELRLGLNEEVTGVLGSSLGVDDASLLILVLLIVLLSVGEHLLSLLSSILLVLVSSLTQFFKHLGVSGLLLHDVLRNHSNK